MARVIAPEILSSRFSYCARDRIFSAEASDFGRRPVGGRVYEDAADFGFVMVSDRTRGKVLFLEGGDKRDREGDLLWITYLGYDLQGRPLSGAMAGLECRIYND